MAPTGKSGQVKKLVEREKRSRINRVYYEKYYNVSDIRLAGVLQSAEKSVLDRVQLEKDKNEFIHLFGFDQCGSYFNLRLTIISLYPDSNDQESPFRLGSVEFTLGLKSTDEIGFKRYHYNNEQLIDYREKRQQQYKHEHGNVYKIGSLSLETVLPFAFSRILLNGLVRRQLGDDDKHQLVPIKVTISTHPTCDKYDFSYNFDTNYIRSIIEKSLDEDEHIDIDERHLMGLVREDRIDQPMMFQGQLSYLNEKETPSQRQFIMWGAKSKKFLNAKNELKGQSDLRRDNLFAWVESGQQIHLTRPVGHPNLVYGLVHNAFDYASYLYSCNLLRQNHGDESSFNALSSFADLTPGDRIKLRAFKRKDYKLEVVTEARELEPFRVNINGFDGWAIKSCENLGESFHQAQARLWQMQITDSPMSLQLAQERLLGGKANSLIQLVRINSMNEITLAGGVGVSVPRGIAITCQAYRHWAQSDARILQAIHRLDVARRVLAAKTVHVNPLSDKYISILEAHKRLKEECERAGEILRSCPLPAGLKEGLRCNLAEMFGGDHRVGERKFAVRSSALGEDSLETSAAGQMKTILGAQGLENISESIVACWASQFETEAVSYKTQNGLEFDLPMSVVVQELIDCEVAGVAATCNPLSGNKCQLEITANLGLGEGVVSGKRTDTVRLNLARAGLEWDEKLEEHVGELSLSNLDCIERIPSDANGAEKFCLNDEQIIALANLLLQLRRRSGPVKEREIEWGITSEWLAQNGGSSSSSSSSSSSTGAARRGATFRIHLLQSRPLTHLQRLDSHEIDHELDYGFCSPMDNMSRANLGEVMPGALCPINSSYFQPIAASYASMKPFEENQTRKIFVADSFGFYAQMAVMVVSYTDTIKRLISTESEKARALAMVAIQTMIGTRNEEIKDKQQLERIEKFHDEKVNPLSQHFRHGLGTMLAIDSGMYQVFKAQCNYQDRAVKLSADMPSIDSLIERLVRDKNAAEVLIEVERQASQIWLRLCTQTKPLAYSWKCHMIATVTSMSLNMMCLKLMSDQPAYPDDLRSAEILNDFSTMMRQPQRDELGEQTESGDISKLLSHLIEIIIDEGELARVQDMTHKELYDFLNNSQSNSQANKLFHSFLKRNGHRAHKEFCMATNTWGDDCSYIIRTLAMRLKQNGANTTEQRLERQRRVADSLAEHSKKVAEIEAKLAGGKYLLTKYAFSRARNATVRREQSKSMLIKALHKYRLAFRHLGGLLCLLGRLPSADLIFQLAGEELDRIVNCKQFATESPHHDLPRIIYKARRRQQRAKLFQNVQFPRPNLRFDEMVESIAEQLSGNIRVISSEKVQDDKSKVSGLTSCSGKVTGRACVVASLDEMEQLKPNDILITYSIDISWSVYFFALAGIVTELGGIISHGAVVAREYGIPTLCTAVGACSAFKTGQIITLDADNGVCYLADEQ